MSYREAVEFARSISVQKFVAKRKLPRVRLPTPAVNLQPERIALLRVRRKHGARTKRPELMGLPRRVYLTLHARIRRIENKAMR